jgi:hypothetical protein
MKRKVIEMLKRLMEKDFDQKDSQLFIDTMCESLESFRYGIIFVDQFDRNLPEYQRITEYHKVALQTEDKKYRKIFDKMSRMAIEGNKTDLFDSKLLSPEDLEYAKQKMGGANESQI